MQIRPLEALLQSLRHLQAGPRVLQSRAPRLEAHFLAQLAGGAAEAAPAGNGEEETDDDEWAEKKKESAPRQANGGEGTLAVHAAAAWGRCWLICLFKYGRVVAPQVLAKLLTLICVNAV